MRPTNCLKLARLSLVQKFEFSAAFSFVRVIALKGHSCFNLHRSPLSQWFVYASQVVTMLGQVRYGDKAIDTYDKYE